MVGAWAAQALASRHTVGLATHDVELDFGAIDALYGTSLAGAGPRLTHVPTLAGSVWPRNRLTLLRSAWSFRVLRRELPYWDVVVGVVNEMPRWLNASVEYIHCPSVTHRAVHRSYRGIERLKQHLNVCLFRLVAGSADPREHFRAGPRSVASGSFLANSQWTADLFADLYLHRPYVLFPPIRLPDESMVRSDSERTNAVVCLGRIVAEKRIEEAVEIVAAVRKHDPSFTLEIVGDGQGSYADSIRRLAERESFVTFHGQISRARLFELLNAARFGVHPRREEHFGMAPAEMVAAGQLALVHDSGGAPEVVAGRPELRFRDVPEAVEKLLALSRDPVLRDELRCHLAAHASQFRGEVFCTKLLEFVESAMSSGVSAAPQSRTA